MKKILLEHALFVNRAPFKKVAFNFNENEITLLTSVNGKGKTTILSYITDAFYEMARKHFQIEFAGRENKYYRISTAVMNLNPNEPSFVYLRFRTNEGIAIDYLDIAGNEFYDTINAQGVAQQLPDVWYTRTFDVPVYASKGWTTSMQPLVDRDSAEVDVDDFWPAEV
ncbi:MAG: AAA family ATPase, partial [Ignavibacteria bacterium]|nr:AAA family ATPase [Ignavibacteria bacterium]